MSSYDITARISVSVENAAALGSVARGSGDEKAQVQSAIDAGLQELSRIAGRYGFRVIEATATVDEA
jgi:hypothetical protein